MRKPKKWTCSLYDYTVHFMVGWPEKEAEEYMKKKYQYTIDFRSFSGQHIKLDNGESVIWTYPKDGKKYYYCCLVHECIHAAAYCLDWRGIGPQWPKCEPLTYLADKIYYEARKSQQ